MNGYIRYDPLGHRTSPPVPAWSELDPEDRTFTYTRVYNALGLREREDDIIIDGGDIITAKLMEELRRQRKGVKVG